MAILCMPNYLILSAHQILPNQTCLLNRNSGFCEYTDSSVHVLVITAGNHCQVQDYTILLQYCKGLISSTKSKKMRNVTQEYPNCFSPGLQLISAPKQTVPKARYIVSLPTLQHCQVTGTWHSSYC